MQIHNKLVRDKIPEMIIKDDKKPITKILNQKDYITELRKKSKEELKEYLAAKTDEEAIEELADLLEIIHVLAEQHGSSFEEVEEQRKQKLKTRGGFSEKILLIKVDGFIWETIDDLSGSALGVLWAISSK